MLKKFKVTIYSSNESEKGSRILNDGKQDYVQGFPVRTIEDARDFAAAYLVSNGDKFLVDEV